MQTTAVKLRKTGWVTIRPLALRSEDGHGLAAYVEGDREPAAWARLSGAVIEVEVAERHRGRGIEEPLVERLAADARAAGLASPRVRSEGARAPEAKLLPYPARV